MKTILILLALVGICCAQTRTLRLVPSPNPYQSAIFNQYQFGQNRFNNAGKYNAGRYAGNNLDGRYRSDNSGRYVDDGRYIHDNSGQYIPDGSGRYNGDGSGRYNGEGIDSSRYAGGGGQYVSDLGGQYNDKNAFGKGPGGFDTRYNSGKDAGFSGKDTGIGIGSDNNFGKIKNIGSGSNNQGLGSVTQSTSGSSSRSNVGIGSGSNVGSSGVGKSPLGKTGSETGKGSGIQTGTSSGLGPKDGFNAGKNIGSGTGIYAGKIPTVTITPLKQIETVKPVGPVTNIKPVLVSKVSRPESINTGINKDLSRYGTKAKPISNLSGIKPIETYKNVNVGPVTKDKLAGAAQNQFGKTVLPPGSGSGSNFGNLASATSNTGKFVETGWKILRQENEADEDGYHYLYDTENRISVEERGKLHNKGTDQEAMRAVGFFQFTGPDNVIYKVTYTSDENGFIPEGAHLPTPPPVPDYILKSLEYQRSIGEL